VQSYQTPDDDDINNNAEIAIDFLKTELRRIVDATSAEQNCQTKPEIYDLINSIVEAGPGYTATMLLALMKLLANMSTSNEDILKKMRALTDVIIGNIEEFEKLLDSAYDDRGPKSTKAKKDKSKPPIKSTAGSNYMWN